MSLQFDVMFVPCSTFGGGWAVPLTDEGHDWLENWFNDGPAETPVAETAWIVEPQDVRDLAECAMSDNIAVHLAD